MNNIEAPDEFFNTVKTEFLNLDIRIVDENIQPILHRLRQFKYLEEICPRWSCESHSDKSENYFYEITFVTRGTGSTKLHNIFRAILQECDNPVCNRLEVIPLIHQNFDYNVEHIVIKSYCQGIDSYIKQTVDVWNKVLDRVEKGEL